MPIVLRGAAVVPTGNPTTGFSVSVPASVVADDLLFLTVTSRDSAGAGSLAVTDNDAGGNAWAKIANSTDHKATVWYKRATSGTAGKSVTVASAVGSASGVLKCFSGADTGATPYTNVSVETNASANETHAGFTPANADSMVCAAVFNYANDNSVTSLSFATLGATSEFQKLSTGGSDCGNIFGHVLQQGGPSATGNLTWAQTDGATYSIVWAIKPAAATIAEGDGAASGVGETTGTGAMVTGAMGACDGAASTSGASVAVIAGALSSAGVASCSATTATVWAATAQGAGSSTAIAENGSSGPVEADASASGRASVTGAASWVCESVGASTGAGATSGVAAQFSSAEGSASGTGSSSATASWISSATFTGTSTASVSGAAGYTFASAGFSAGTSTASALTGTDSTIEGRDGVSSGAATCTGVGAFVWAATASGAGTAVCCADASAFALSVAYCAGVAVVTGLPVVAGVPQLDLYPFPRAPLGSPGTLILYRDRS